MKKVYRSFSIILTLALVLAFMPVTAFAAEISNDNPNAACTITNSEGKEYTLEYDFFTGALSDFPKNGDRINIFLDGNRNKNPDEVYVYQSGDKVFKNNAGETVEWEIKNPQYGDRSFQMRVYKGVFPPYYSYGYIYNIKFEPKAVLKRAPLKGATYTPSSVTVYSEDIKEKAYDGSWFYNFRNRAQHTKDSKTWKSAYEEGDIIEVTLQDNSRIRFINKIVWTDKGYNDRFVSDSGEIVVAKTNDVKLATGNNRVEVYLMNIPGNNKMYVNALMKTGSRSQYESQQPASGTQASSSTGSIASKMSSVSKSVAAAIQSITIAKAKIISAKKTNSKIKLNLKPLTKKQLKNVSKIQVQYSTDKKFKKAETKSVFINKNKKTYTTKKLKKDTYYTRVRNMWKVGNKKYYSKWSPVKIVRFK